jgi:uncharacterized protein (TIGR03435 family)
MCGPKHLLVMSVTIASLAQVPMQAQIGSTNEPQFEVTSIKPSAPGTHGPTLYNPTNTRFAVANVTPKYLIAYAYDVSEFQIIGGPSWIDADEYDIVAKPQGEASGERIKAMTKSLLAERFSLKLHRESKEQSVFALVVAKGGPNLQRSAAQGGPEVRGNRGGRLTMRKVTMEMMAAQLAARVLGRPVIDKTGIAGEFDVNLEWTPDEKPDGGPSLFAALQEQLGLKLETQKGSVEVFVIDHIEKPSAN